MPALHPTFNWFEGLDSLSHSRVVSLNPILDIRALLLIYQFWYKYNFSEYNRCKRMHGTNFIQSKFQKCPLINERWVGHLSYFVDSLYFFHHGNISLTVFH